MQKIIKALEEVARVVSNRDKIDAKRIAITAQFLSDLPEKAVIAAIQVHAKESAFFPAPAEIRKRIYSPEQTGLDGVRNIWKAISRVGIYGDPRSVLSDDEMDAVESIGGWKALCNSDETDAPILSAQLKKSFLVLHARRMIDRQLGPGQTVAGLLEEWEEQENIDLDPENN